MPENIIKCERCGDYLSAKFLDTHICDIAFKGVKEIPIIFFFERKVDDRTIIIAKGLDGILYRLVSQTKTFAKYQTDFDTKNNRQGLDRTNNRMVFILLIVIF